MLVEIQLGLPLVVMMAGVVVLPDFQQLSALQQLCADPIALL